jgi:hypothetical protein
MFATFTENNGLSPYAGLPRWVKASAIVGFPVAACMVLISYILFVQATETRAQTKLLEQHTVLAVHHDANLAGYLNEHREEQQMLRLILAQICSNGAKTNLERNACFPQKPSPTSPQPDR